MGRSARDVKGARRYDIRGREEKARQQRSATLAVAKARFLERGYAGTTVELIADEAGVSPAKVYKSYGGKASPLRGPLPTRPGVTPREVRDVLWACSSPELYDLMVVQRRWTAARYGRFVGETMAGSLL